MKPLILASLSIAAISASSAAFAGSDWNCRHMSASRVHEVAPVVEYTWISPVRRSYAGTLVFYDPSREESVSGADPFVRVPLRINPANAAAAAADAARYGPLE